MAGLTPISAYAQVRAIAYLRGRLFLNGFRRKGGTGELIARIILYPILGFVALLPIAGAGFAAYGAVHTRNVPLLGFIFWGIFLLWQLVSINIAPPGLSFDPESLIRFPLLFGRYLGIRLLLGLLAASTVIGSLAVAAAVCGIAIAQPELLPIAAAAALLFIISNILFTRMIFAWVDRWLSTRRAREIFTGLIFAFGIGMQYLNATFNGLGKHMTRTERLAKMAAAEHIVRVLEPFAAVLPPGLAANAVVSDAQHHAAGILSGLLGLVAYSALFLAIFAWRVHREFRGESLSDAATGNNEPVTKAKTLSEVSGARVSDSAEGWRNYGLPPSLAAVLEKEFVYLRRNTSQFYGLIAPVLMVLIFAGRLGAVSRTGFGFPIGVAYSLLGLAAFSYNAFGVEQEGIQLFFLAPVRFRTVVLAKNSMVFAITVVQVMLVYAIVVYAVGVPPMLLTAATLLWILFSMLTSTAIGNIRSLLAPKKMDPGKLARRQASQLSALMSVGILLVSAAIGAGLYWLGLYLGRSWLPVLVLGLLAGAAVVFYLRVLEQVDTLALSHREILIEELCKAA